MTEDRQVPRFPLEWPLGWKRTPAHRRTASSFSTTRTVDKRMTVALATDRLQGELDRLGARHATLSTNVSLRLDGRPRSDENPADPGAAIYFSFRGKATVLACDRYKGVSENIAAIAAHIDALRRIERYGVGTIEQALAGYKALPADTAADWRMVFGIPAGLAGAALREQLEKNYRALARERHPDVTHDDGAAMAHLNRAHDYALTELAG